MTGKHVKKTGILLVNLGSPRSPTTRDVRRFLREFLGDPRVVNLPRPLWWLILNLFVLPFRPKRSAHAYQTIWTEEGSPLAVFTEQLTAKLRNRLSNELSLIDYAMRYGAPSVSEKIHSFREEGVERLLILPLYPQFSSTTSASVYDALVDSFKNAWHLPDVHFISDFHQHSAYISALTSSVTDFWLQKGRPQKLVMSFHGVPALLTKKGDPYFIQCQKTALLLAQSLGLNEDEWVLVFQSRFGKAEWLKPYCVEELMKLPKQGVTDIHIICPGFSVDCLETLEEIAMANREIFMEAGGKKYEYIPALNDTNAHVDLMSELILPYLAS